MKVYQNVTGVEECTIEFNTLVEDSYSGFSIAAGTGDVVAGEGGSTGLLNSGFVFSGNEGYIFDQSGRFVGGYEAGEVFNILVHNKSDSTMSFFINDVLISNNYSTSTGFDYIEFDKHGESIVNITHSY